MARDSRELADLEHIVRTHGGWLHACARRQLHDPAMADDVTQAVFILFWRKRPNLASEGELVAWLHRTAGYCAANAQRLQAIRAQHEKEAAMRQQQESSPQTELMSCELDAALNRLAIKDRQALLLRFSREMGFAEVGEAMGISPNAARMRVDRALARLQDMFAEQPSSATLGAILSLSDAPGHWAQQTIAAISDGNISNGAVELLRRMRQAQRRRGALAGGAALAAATALVLALTFQIRTVPAAAPAVVEPTQPASVRTLEPRSAPGLPMQPGFPLALPGTIVAAPSVGDLDGDGKLEILVSCMERSFDRALSHSTPDSTCQVFAIRLDGTVQPGWPVVLRNREERAVVRQRKPDFSENWASSPSTADLDGDGADEVVVVASDGVDYDRKTCVIRGNGKVLKTFRNGDPWVSVPLVDADGDNSLDVIVGGVVSGWDGRRLRWNSFPVGFGPCAGDADGDGKPEFFLPTFTDRGEIQGFDHLGNMLQGWPVKVGRQCLFPPVMGDVDGDGEMEVIAGDQRNHILAWKCDGFPLEGTHNDGEITGVFKDLWAGGASPALADLDGDGAAEIVVFSGDLYAWRGSGAGVYRPDGLVAAVGMGGAMCMGCTVADLGGDGIMDFFAGGKWLKVTRDGQVSITPLLPKGAVRETQVKRIEVTRDGQVSVTPLLPEDAVCATQVTVCDLDGDGRAELVYGSADGQLFVYRTEMTYADRFMEWPTPNHDFRHTGAWTKGGLKPRRPAGQR